MSTVSLTPLVGQRAVTLVSLVSGNRIEIGAPTPAQAIKMVQIAQGPAGPEGPPGSGGAGQLLAAVTAGGPAAFTAVLGLTTLTPATVVLLTFNQAPAAAATINVDGLGAVPLLTQAGNPLAGGEVLANLIGFWRISATGAQLINMG